MSFLEDELERCAREHAEAARVYERGGNASGAAELRRVENLLWALRRCQVWSTVLPYTSVPIDTGRTSYATTNVRHPRWDNGACSNCGLVSCPGYGCVWRNGW